MNVAIISNIENGIGLQREFELLRDFLAELGHKTTGIQYDKPIPDDLPSFDLAIFLEVVPRSMANLAPVRFAFLNPEWTVPETVKVVQRHIDKVLAKTHEAQRIFESSFPGKSTYVGFLTRDQYDPTIPRKRQFLHIGGNSSFRGTQAVYDAWKWEKNGKGLRSDLYIVSTALQERPNADVQNVFVMDRVDESALKLMQNECMFHLIPSGTEGFGHAIHETLSTGNLLITTGSPPMSEIEGAFYIGPVGKSKAGLADVYEVSALDIYSAVSAMEEWSIIKLQEDISVRTRKQFLDANEKFKLAFPVLLNELEHPPVSFSPAKERARPTTPTIAFIGNFAAEHSTENQIKWALEQRLSYEVEMLQENRITAREIYAACEYSKILIWVRTPGWLQIPDEEMFRLLEWCKNEGIRTLSVHLDKFWGIPDREFLIGKIPFWKTEQVWTADGSRQEDFAKRGVNHFWMKPAVSEVYCHPGTPRDEYRCDVGFVGAGAGYHDIYPFRQELLKFLKDTYGERFKHIEGVRGHLLNDAYASMKIAIGDCFAAGTPMYVSDRLAETAGRFGFILHPRVQGFEDFPCAKYNPQDLQDLRAQIEYWLTNERDRQDVRHYCAGYVRKHDTWSIRMAEILEVIQ